VKAGSLKILITGASGQLGHELAASLEANHQVVRAGRDPACAATPGWAHLDLTDEAQLVTALGQVQPDLVVNAAAYTAVDQAEREPELAFQVNAHAPAWMAQWAEQNDRALLHYSTDYVFDGTGEHPYRETDPVAPLNIYGESKQAGEAAIGASGCRHLIFRTSWIYSSRGRNFVLTMLDLARRLPHLRVVGDQVGCPTWARNLAVASVQVIENGSLFDGKLAGGLYHCSDADAVSWHEFARQVFDVATALGILERRPELESITSDQYPQLARRPHWSVLDTTSAQQDLGITPGKLTTSLQRCLKEYRHAS
jgi:dTDP-4-dehydrorhamnose reductase